MHANYLRILLGMSLATGFSTAATAQKCKDLLGWGERIEAEFPGVAPERLVMGSRQNNRLLFLLYADENFIPGAGTAYAKLSESQRLNRARKLIRCRGKMAALPSGTQLWLTNNALRPLQDSRMFPVIVEGVTTVANMRKQYARDLAAVQAGQMGTTELNNLNAAAALNYNLLWPSEIEALQTAIRGAEGEAAERELRVGLDRLETNAGDQQNFSRWRDFSRAYADQLQKAPPAVAQEVRASVARGLKASVADLLPGYAERISAIDSEADGAFVALRQQARVINRDLAGALHLVEVQDLLATIRSRQTALFRGREAEFRRRIGGAKTPGELGEIEAMLADIDPADPVGKEIARLLTDQKRVISVEQQRRQREALAAAGEARRKAVQVRQVRKQSMAAAEQRIAARRQRLRVKYGVNLPSFEQLFYVRAYGAPIASRYKVADGTRFKNYVESMGYMLTSRSGKLSSDLTTFRNRLGYEVSTFRLSPEKIDAVTNARLKIRNVPPDILDLYYAELITLYRHRDKSTRDAPRAVSPAEDLLLNGYVKSGSTFYRLEVKDGNLNLDVSSAEDWPFPVVAEHLGDGWYEVTPYSTNTDLSFAPGDQIQFVADGQVKLGNFVGNSGPEGVKGFTQYNLEPGLPHGALIARVGKRPYLLVGKGRTLTVRQAGKLFMKINDKGRNNNEGNYYVRVIKL